MTHSEIKHRKTRKPHICESCKVEIPAGTICYWYKGVAFHDSDVGRDQWHEGYICPKCEEEGEKEWEKK